MRAQSFHRSGESSGMRGTEIHFVECLLDSRVSSHWRHCYQAVLIDTAFPMARLDAG